eukprot:m.164603 g.164603  ORF g.164603 m.164603 type:complete len:409 (+) comp16584_c0_seq1:186-1412(+)
MAPPRRPHRAQRGTATRRGRSDKDDFESDSSTATQETTASPTEQPKAPVKSTWRSWLRYAPRLYSVVAQVMRLSLLSASIHLWNYDRTVLAYVGFASLLSMRHLLWSTLQGSYTDARQSGTVSLAFGIKLLLLLLPLGWFLKCIHELWLVLEWRSLMMLLYPLVLRLSAQHMLPSSKASIQQQWEQARAPHYKLAALTTVTSSLVRECVFDLIEGGYYAGLMPILLAPPERAWMDRLQCVVLGVLSFAEAGTLTVLELYYIHGTELYHAARRLGAWKQVNANGAITWQPGQPFLKNRVVRHRKKSYRALDDLNTADPSDRIARYFWFLFRRPDRSLQALVLQQGLLIASQILAVIVTQHWLVISIWGGSLGLSYLTLIYAIWLRRRVSRYRQQDEAFWAANFAKSKHA